MTKKQKEQLINKYKLIYNLEYVKGRFMSNYSLDTAANKLIVVEPVVIDLLTGQRINVHNNVVLKLRYISTLHDNKVMFTATSLIVYLYDINGGIMVAGGYRPFESGRPSTHFIQNKTLEHFIQGVAVKNSNGDEVLRGLYLRRYIGYTPGSLDSNASSVSTMRAIDIELDLGGTYEPIVVDRSRGIYIVNSKTISPVPNITQKEYLNPEFWIYNHVSINGKAYKSSHEYTF